MGDRDAPDRNERNYLVNSGYTPQKEGGDQPRVREVAPRFTYQDYLKLSDDERYEVIEGELVLVPPPSTLHQGLVMRISQFLYTYVAAQNLGVVLVAPVDVVLSEENVVQPDVLFVTAGRLSIVTEACVAGAPDLAVEILSKSSIERDRTVKRTLYQRYGIKEYWIVDPVGKSIEVFADNHAIYTTQDGPTRLSPFLAELVVDIADLFREPYYFG